MPYFLSKYNPDPLRFYLTATAPETRDTEACPACPERSRGEGTEGFFWEDFVERSNNELVATWGTQSVANRMLSFAYKRFDGQVPEPGDPSSPFPRSVSGQAGQGLDADDRALLEKVEAGFQTGGELYNACKFRAALGEALALAREANGYTFGKLSAGLDRKAPWFQIKEDPQAAATSVYVTQSVRVIDNLKTILAPTLCVPHTAQKLACGASI